MLKLKKIFLLTLLFCSIGTTFEQINNEYTKFVKPGMFLGKAFQNIENDSVSDIPQVPCSFFDIRIMFNSAMEKGEKPESMRTDLSNVVPNDLLVPELFGAVWPQQEKWWSMMRFDTMSIQVNKGAFMNAGGVDFVQVDFRKGSAYAPTARIKVWGFVTKTGKIHGLHGEFPLKVPFVVDGDWYFAVHNPRILSVMSATRVHPTLLGLTSYDFTTGADKFFKGGGVEIHEGFWGAIGGEGKSHKGYGNNVLDLFDWLVCHNLIVNGPLLNVYSSSDADFDGDVDIDDEQLIWNSAIAESTVPWIDEFWQNTPNIQYHDFDFTLPTYQLTAGNFVSVSDSIFSFDVHLLSTSTETFNYAAGQYILDIDSNLNVTSIEMSDPMMQELTSFRQVGNQIQLIMVTRPGGTYQVSGQSPGSKVARFKVVYSNSGHDTPTPVRWVNIPSNIPTLMYADIGGQAIPITTPETHLYDGGLTNVGSVNVTLPLGFSLSQNFPNPFNPSTTITYALPVNSNVSLSVYDINGREVMNLLNAQKPAGNHSIVFDGSTLSSGVYFYKLQTSRYIETKKMMLIK